jgi:L-amino acid N-acyltransferase YncA
MTALNIRAAVAADADAIAAIYAYHVDHGTATFDTVPRTPADEFRGQRIPGTVYAIAAKNLSG